MSRFNKLINYLNTDGKEKKYRENLPWSLFCFLFVIFYFATWYDPLYTIRDPRTAQEIGLLVEKGNLGRRIALFALGGWGLFNLIFKVRKRDIRIDLLASLIVFYIILAAISISWSDEKLLTLRKVVAMSLLWLGAAGIAIRYSIRIIQYFAFFSGLITIIFGVICEVFLGTFHPFDITYRFAGTFHPNTQGMNCAILAIASFSLFKTETKWKSMFKIMTIGAFIFIYLTKSRTSFVSAGVVISTYWLITSSWRSWVTVLFVTIWLSCILVFSFGDNLFAFLGRATYIGRDVSDLDTISLRKPLWQECFNYIGQHPLLGYGYDSFWTPRQVMQASIRQGWDISHSHCGYIELALGVGVIGLFTFISILFLAGKRALFLYFKTGDHGYVYCFSMILWLFLQMFFEIINMHPFIATFLSIILFFKLSFTNVKH